MIFDPVIIKLSDCTLTFSLEEIGDIEKRVLLAIVIVLAILQD
jgi:hypothetical protein